MTHLWKSLGQKRTVAIKYEPSPRLLAYLSDMREATRMALAYALVDAQTAIPGAEACPRLFPSPCGIEAASRAAASDPRRALLRREKSRPNQVVRATLPNCRCGSPLAIRAASPVFVFGDEGLFARSVRGKV